MRALRDVGIAAASAAAAGSARRCGCSARAPTPRGASARAGPDARVLLFLTEGVTDPDAYETIVGAA
jgi:hypothetical protein